MIPVRSSLRRGIETSLGGRFGSKMVPVAGPMFNSVWGIIPPAEIWIEGSSAILISAVPGHSPQILTSGALSGPQRTVSVFTSFLINTNSDSSPWSLESKWQHIINRSLVPTTCHTHADKHTTHSLYSRSLDDTKASGKSVIHPLPALRVETEGNEFCLLLKVGIRKSSTILFIQFRISYIQL